MKKMIINLPSKKTTEIPTDQDINKPINVVVVSTPSEITIKEYDDCIDVYVGEENECPVCGSGCCLNPLHDKENK